MPNPSCFGSLQVCAMRVALLDETGAPLPGANNGYVSDAVVTIDVGVELSEGDDFELKNGCGNICQTFKDCDRIKRLNLSLELCQLDYELVQMLVGGTLFTDSGSGILGTPLGWEFPASTDPCEDGVSFEFWTKAWDGAEQAAPGAPLSGIAYHHWVATRAKFQLADNTVENDILTFALEGFGEENDALPADGPFGDWPAWVSINGGFTTTGGIFLDDSIPTAACGSIEVPA